MSVLDNVRKNNSYVKEKRKIETFYDRSSCNNCAHLVSCITNYEKKLIKDKFFDKDF